MERFAFCPHCGASREPGSQGPHLHCRSCGEVTYRNPAVGVAVILTENDQVLLGRRTRGAKAGLWCIPCGYVEWDEDVRDAARREVAEETGLQVEVGEVFAVHSNFHDREKQTVGIWFRGVVCGGQLAAGDDLSEVRFFALDQIPELAFPTDRLVIERLRQVWQESAAARR